MTSEDTVAKMRQSIMSSYKSQVAIGHLVFSSDGAVDRVVVDVVRYTALSALRVKYEGQGHINNWIVVRRK